MVARPGDAPLADLGALACRQDHVHQLDFAQFVEHPSRLLAHSRVQAPLPERLPRHVCQEADENVRQDAIFFLLPDRPDRQVALLDAEGRFGRG